MEGFLNLIFGYFLVVGKLPVHKPYITQLILGEDSSIWMVPEMFGEVLCEFAVSFKHSSWQLEYMGLGSSYKWSSKPSYRG